MLNRTGTISFKQLLDSRWKAANGKAHRGRVGEKSIGLGRHKRSETREHLLVR